VRRYLQPYEYCVGSSPPAPVKGADRYRAIVKTKCRKALPGAREVIQSLGETTTDTFIVP